MRPIRLEFFDHAFICPLCSVEILYTSTQTVIVSSSRKCPSCEGELLIHEGAITALSGRKPPKRAKANRTR
jgi:Zn-finger nucleic acid-binding protein